MTTTRQELLAAFDRIKNNTPIRIDVERKISPAAVEDEAGVGRSLLRNNKDYEDIFKMVVEAKRQQSGGSSTKGKTSSIANPEIRELKAKLKESKAETKALQGVYDELLACNAELANLLNTKGYKKHLEGMTRTFKDNIHNIADIDITKGITSKTKK